MDAPTLLNSAANTSTNNTVVSGAVSPTANALMIVTVLSTETGGDATHDSLSAGFSISGSWTKRTSAQIGSGGASVRVSIWTAQASSSPGSGAVTCTMSTNQRRKTIYVAEIEGYDTTTPVPQVANNTGSSTSLTVTLPSTPASTSCVIGFVGTETATTNIAPGSGFTELGELSTGGPAFQGDSQLQYDLDNADTTCDWTTLPSTTNAGVAIEIAAAATATLEQTAYRYYDDDGDEDESTALAAENTDITIEKGVAFRLRGQVDATGNPDAAQFQIEIRRDEHLLLEDDFTDNSFDTNLWEKRYHTANTDQDVTVLETGGVLEITPVSSVSDPHANGALSLNTFDFTGCHMIIETTQVMNAEDGAFINPLWIYIDDLNGAGFSVENGALYFAWYLAGDSSDFTAIAWNISNHAWVKFLHNATTDNFGWYTSPDGSDWTLQRTKANPWTITSAKLQPFSGGTYLSVASPGSAKGRNFSFNDNETAWEAVAASGTDFILSASSNIAASGENTTARLSAPGGKTTGDFEAGRIQDDENPADSVDLTADAYTEVEWCIEANATALGGYIYSFRITDNGAALDGYDQTPRVQVQVLIVPTGIASGEAFGTPAISLAIVPTGITSDEAFGTAVVTSGGLSISPTGIPSDEAFGSHTLSPGAVVITPTGIASGEAFGTPSLTLFVTPAGIASEEAFGTTSLTLFIVPAGIASGENFGTAVLTSGLTILPIGIVSGEAFGSHTLSPGAVDISPTGIVSGESFGSPSLILVINPTSIPTGEAFGAASLILFIVPGGIASGEAFGTAVVASGFTIQPAGIASGETFGSHTVQPGAVSISPAGIGSGESFGTPSLILIINPTSISTGEAFGAASLILFIVPGGIASGEAFGTAVLASGLTIFPTGIASGEAFGSHTLSPGAVDISPTGITSAEAFGSPSLTLFIVPAGISSGEAFGSPSLALFIVPTGITSGEAFGTALIGSGLTVFSIGIASGEAFGSHTLQPGAASILPTGITSGEGFGSHLLTLSILPNGIVSGEAFGAAILTSGFTILANGIASAESFGSSLVIPGSTTILPAGIGSAELFGASVVTSGFTILANGIASAESFGAPTVTVGAAMIIPIGIVSGEAFGTAAIMLAVIVPPTGTIRGGSITGSVRRSGTAGTIRIPS